MISRTAANTVCLPRAAVAAAINTSTLEAIIHSHNTCDILTVETYLNIIASKIYYAKVSVVF